MTADKKVEFIKYCFSYHLRHINYHPKKMRITNNTTKTDFVSRINSQQNRLNVLNERIVTGKKINRPSDDPRGAQAVLNLRTSQTEIKQFTQSAAAAVQKLSAADETLNSYQNILDTVRTTVSRGLTDTSSQASRNVLATELEALRGRILEIANTKNGDEYVFGGTNHTLPPFDPATAAPPAVVSGAQYVQIEPGAKAIPTGVTAQSVFADASSDIFADLTNAIDALRGTGNQAADKTTLQNTMTRLSFYADQSAVARAAVGANMSIATAAQENLANAFLAIDERAAEIEGADFAETAVELAETQKSLEATLQVAANSRRNLFDFL